MERRLTIVETSENYNKHYGNTRMSANNKNYYKKRMYKKTETYDKADTSANFAKNMTKPGVYETDFKTTTKERSPNWL